MTLALSMPGGSEWIMILLFGGFLILMPILAIVFYIQNKELKKQVTTLTKEKNELLKSILNKV